MGDVLRLRVATPFGSVMDEDVAKVTLRSSVGEFCALPSHCGLLAVLTPGRLMADTGQGVRTFVADDGFVEVGPDHVNVVTRRCEDAAKMDRAALEGEAGALERRLSETPPREEPERIELMSELMWVRACLDATSSLTR